MLMENIIQCPLLVAMYGSTSTSDCSWLVLQPGKACYNAQYH